jgi:hypothetical protein
MNKQRPENSVTEMKMNWMLALERANQKANAMQEGIQRQYTSRGR